VQAYIAAVSWGGRGLRAALDGSFSIDVTTGAVMIGLAGSSR
jgi:hypothetical protein